MNTSSINIHRFWRGIAAAIAVLSIASGNLFAQNSTGTIRGTVSGAGGAPLGSAQIVARNTDNGVQRGRQSDDAGFYTLAGLVPGNSTVTVRRIRSAPANSTLVRQIRPTPCQQISVTE